MREVFLYAGIAAAVGLACFAAVVPAADIPPPKFNVKDYGAVGDGNPHPACTYLQLPNLAALRAYKGGIYKFATACSNEMDWLAATAAITAGKDVVYPEGTFLNDQTISLPASGEGPSPASISLIGVSSTRSVLSWPTDLGTGHAAVSCNNRSSNICGGTIQHLSLRGPAASGAWLNNLGKQVANMDGFHWGARRQVDDMFIENFNKCFSIVGDQTDIIALSTANCTYGIYLEAPNPTNFGDLVFIKPILAESSKAAIGVSPTAHLDEYTFISLCACVAPWGILKELGGSTSPAEIVHGSTFISSQFENLGNGLIGDDNPGDTRLGIDYNTRWIQTEFQWNSVYAWTSMQSAAIFNLYQSYLSVIDGIREPRLWTPGQFAIFNIRYPTQSKIMGDLTTLLQNASRKGLPFSRYSSDSWLAEITGLPPRPVGDLQAQP